MRLTALALFGLTAPSLSMACPGKGDVASASVETASATKVSVDAAACAKKSEMVGSACSYSTGMMASRVLEQGKMFTFSGTLNKAEPLENKVAAPFTVGPDAIRVIANEVVESATLDERHDWKGKVLEVDGIKYFVVTGFDSNKA